MVSIHFSVLIWKQFFGRSHNKCVVIIVVRAIKMIRYDMFPRLSSGGDAKWSKSGRKMKIGWFIACPMHFNFLIETLWNFSGSVSAIIIKIISFGKFCIVHVFLLETHKSLVKLHCKEICDFLLAFNVSSFSHTVLRSPFLLLLIVRHGNKRNIFPSPTVSSVLDTVHAMYGLFYWQCHRHWIIAISSKCTRTQIPLSRPKCHRHIANICLCMHNVILFSVVHFDLEWRKYASGESKEHGNMYIYKKFNTLVLLRRWFFLFFFSFRDTFALRTLEFWVDEYEYTLGTRAMPKLKFKRTDGTGLVRIYNIHSSCNFK